MESYYIIIAASVIIIISYLFNLLSKRTNIPSVLMLIAFGILIKLGAWNITGMKKDLMPFLNILGIVGLIMIVLEAAIDLELTKDKWPIIWKSFSIALITLFLSIWIISIVVQFYVNVDQLTSIIYAIPISIMSSAIVIPSVVNLPEHKKEFMIYESTFSDILGIMAFYFVLGSVEVESNSQVGLMIFSNITITVLISVIVSYLLIILFQHLKTEIKLFLLIAILVALYSIGKMFHLSSLLIILFFGLVLKNRELFFRGYMKRYLNEEVIRDVFKSFKVITLESSFVVRTFFFVMFGISISLASLGSFKVAMVSLIILASMFFIRWVFLWMFLGKDIHPQLFSAPRGLITILLFFSIPEEFRVPENEFSPGILLYIILLTSIFMTVALIRYGKKKEVKGEPEDITGSIITTDKTALNENSEE